MDNMKLNYKDLKLIAELEKNSRASITQMARAIGVSKEVANYRLKKLIASGLVKEFSAVIDYFSLGFELYRMLVNLHNIKENTIKEILSDLKKSKMTSVHLTVQSQWDLDIRMWIKRPEEFYEFYEGFVQKYSDFIQNKEFSIITRMYLFRHSYLYGEHEAIVLKSQKNPQIIEEADYAVLYSLKENPKMEIINLSKKLGMPSTTLNYKIKQLMAKGIIKCFVPVLNVSLLGYNTYIVLMSLSNPSKKNQVVEYLSQKPNVTEIHESIGETDIEFRADFKTAMELEAFLEKLRIEMPYINDFEIIMAF